MDNLPLRDIHLPQPIGWWPPAPGWWVLLALLLLLMAAGVVLFIRRRRVTAMDQALANLNRIEADASLSTRQKLQAVSMLMKRVAMSVRGREEVAGLEGRDWFMWLDNASGLSQVDDGRLVLLTQLPYRPDPGESDCTELMDLCRSWLTSIRTMQKQRKKPA